MSSIRLNVVCSYFEVIVMLYFYLLFSRFVDYSVVFSNYMLFLYFSFGMRSMSDLSLNVVQSYSIYFVFLRWNRGPSSSSSLVVKSHLFSFIRCFGLFKIKTIFSCFVLVKYFVLSFLV